MSLSAAITGVLTLAALEVGLSSPYAAKALGGVATTAAAGINRMIDPKIGLIPNLHDGGSATSSSSSSSSTAAAVPSTAQQRNNAKALVATNLRTARVGGTTSKVRAPKVAPPLSRSEEGLLALLTGTAPSASK